jgi:alkaline phosphatase D
VPCGFSRGEYCTFYWVRIPNSLPKRPASHPIHAGSFGPNELDKTFGPQLAFIKAPSKEQGQNLSPALGLQFFGHVAIDGATETMTVTLKDVDDRALWATTLLPKFG